ncbi:hypothetical protein NBH00_12730 [Paraconexibacter antarcticus]|uniref:Uncharacterized protein n=1 Tax=Paraconexibacter antarcticus TaxID=2949664 RepID=A0ABY5DM93_9ACTN|nr:hypothetical protein [Paraconexibacter antarcticus]UTI62233.1 hypothetical protein NBH00_12730 [Paraconexibacter antarcticus]
MLESGDTVASAYEQAITAAQAMLVGLHVQLTGLVAEPSARGARSAEFTCREVLARLGVSQDAIDQAHAENAARIARHQRSQA